MLITLKSDIRPPTAPVLGTPSVVSTSALTVPMTTVATDTGGVASYQLERSLSPTSGFASISSAATFPYADTGLSPATAYYYRASATDNSGNVGTYSAVVSNTTASVSSGSFDYYIGPSGSDSNNGLTTGTPWAITALNTKRATYAGKTIGFLDGTYDVSAANTPTRGFAVPLYNIQGGSSGSPTVLRSVNVRGAHITAKTPSGIYTGTHSTSNPWNGFHQPHEGGVFANTQGVSQGYITFDGLRMSGEQSCLIRVGQGPTPFAFTTPGIQIINCEIFDCNDAQANNNGGNYVADGANLGPIQMFNTDGAIVRNNYIHDIISYSPTTADHLAAIYEWCCRNTSYTNNTLVNAGGIYGKERPSPGVVIKGNFISDTRSTQGMQDFVGATDPIAATGLLTQVSNNIVVTGGGGLNLHATLGSGSTRTPFKDPLRINNNTVVVGSQANIPLIGYAVNTSIAGQTEDYNNILYVTTQTIFEHKAHSFNGRAQGKRAYNWYTASGSRWRVLSDSTYGPDSGIPYSTVATMAAAVQAAGGLSAASADTGVVQSSQSLSQMFLQTGTFADYYRLADTSTAKNAGKSNGTTGGTTVDMGAWGNLAAAGLTDIGCDWA